MIIRSFLRSPSGWASLVAIAVLALVSVVSWPIFGHAATTVDIVQSLQVPTPQHWLGTDQLGRDLLARLLTATPLSLGLALGSVVISAVVGIPLGALAAVLGRHVRGVLLRAFDTLLAFPGIILGIYACVVIGRGALGPMIGVGIAGSFAYARIASALAMSVGGREYVQAARVVGVGRGTLLFRHVLPNVADALIITTTVNISGAIVAISGLSFLGLGVQPPTSDWGRLLTDGISQISVNPASALAPAAAIALTALTFGFFGEALARATNPLLASRQSAKRKGRRTAPLSVTEQADLPGAEPDAGAVLEVRNLSVLFPGPNGAPLRLVKGVSFRVGRGERVGIVGESGSGKTMTAMAVASLIPHPGVTEGSILLDGNEIGRSDAVRRMSEHEVATLLSRELAVVYQDPMSSLNPALTIGTQLTEAIRQHRGMSRGDAVRRAVERLGEVHIPAAGRQLGRYPNHLSGGMRQRVMIAMALMDEPRLLIADEPTTALDVTIQAQIMELLAEVNQRHDTATILISHNLGLINQNSDRVLVMYAGHIVEELVTSHIQDARHPYTLALLAAVPDMTKPRDQPLADIPGQPPDVADPPPGCPYQPRCPLAVGRCAEEMPPLLARADGQRVACWVANDDLATHRTAELSTR
ncbi:dipeptide/oligopeptide/nickel ABC transporter permease/ATP-binding protein [Actinophytocola oryzae]|uniref:Oligopeptide/dipeptide ABC transporter ATP-binding protein n=1 Tax=Actinophytocola oryzae TaxID=502181 RepID=A0A4R7W115_9PSEU|nr:dipeptide/oligopeptide/nickel ABC transporter permease/ATP-binding protein [Actinophytocola oryzae]TDV56226.1 oligopeptide/dipeptide ABC transporter ATP-binding protein [Actinophytocola oryzae]